MRILFGVQGTGNGHISRCRTLARAFSALGIEVDYIFSGRSEDNYFDMEAFGDYRCFNGMSFVTHKGKISLLKTAKQLKLIRTVKDIFSLDLSAYDLVISDFEPISAWAARRQKKPLLGISNQAVFSYIRLPNKGILTKLIMKYYVPVKECIGLHWYHYNSPILPPIVDKIEALPADGRILIYLPFDDIELITNLFSQYPQHQFVCFHPSIKETEQANNIEFQTLSRDSFIEVLCRCSGTITNAGFALVSETLQLGKKILIKPLSGQFEQTFNADCLAELGLATKMTEFDPQLIEKWLNAPPPEGRMSYPDVALEIVQWIASGRTESIMELSQRLWMQVEFPEKVKQKLTMYHCPSCPSCSP